MPEDLADYEDVEIQEIQIFWKRIIQKSKVMSKKIQDDLL